ncbi:MAG: hypothetical protein WBG92_10780 [Thiohalocapsa sp.]
MGLPSLVVGIADNQRPACKGLAAENQIVYLGHKDIVTTEQLSRTIQALLAKSEHRQRLTRTGEELGDGQGA